MMRDRTNLSRLGWAEQEIGHCAVMVALLGFHLGFIDVEQTFILFALKLLAEQLSLSHFSSILRCVSTFRPSQNFFSYLLSGNCQKLKEARTD